MKKTVLAIMAFFVAFASEAQISSFTSKSINSHTTEEIVVVDKNPNYNRLSLNYSSLKYYIDGDSSDSFDGVEFGWDHGYNVSKGKSLPLYLEFGIHAQYNSGDVELMHEKTEENNHVEISLPLSVTYKFMYNNLYAAPFVGFNLKSAPYDDYVDDFDQKYFQVGYQFGANFGYKALNFQIGYKRDILPIADYKSEDIATGSLFIGLGLNLR